MSGIFTEHFLGGAPGTALTQTNSAFTTTVSGMVFSTAALTTTVGATQSGLVTANAGQAQGVGPLSAASATVFLRFYVRVTARPAANVTIATIRSGTTNRVEMRTTSTGGIQLRNNAATQVLAPVAETIPADTDCRIEWAYDGTAGTQQVRIYRGANVNGSTPDYNSGSVATAAAGAADNLTVGFANNTTATMYLAQVDADNAAWPSAGSTPPANSGSLTLAGTGTLSLSGGATLPVDSAAIGVIGDSLTYANGTGVSTLTDALVAKGWNAAKVKVDGLTGRYISSSAVAPGALDVIDSWVTAGFNPRVLVIALGTNDIMSAQSSSWSNSVDTLLAKVASAFPGTHRIYWVNAVGDPTIGYHGTTGNNNIGDFDTFLDTKLAGRTDTTVLQWDDYVLANLQSMTYWANDTNHVHMSASGYSARTSYVADQVAADSPSPILSGALSLSGAGVLLLSGAATGANSGAGALTLGATGSLTFVGKPAVGGTLVRTANGQLTLAGATGQPPVSGDTVVAVWTGTTWQAVTPLVWTGSSWAAAAVSITR